MHEAEKIKTFYCIVEGPVARVQIHKFATEFQKHTHTLIEKARESFQMLCEGD